MNIRRCLDQVAQVFRRIEERPYHAERIFLVVLFVGLVRLAEEIFLGHITISAEGASHFPVFYLPTYLAFTLFASILVTRDWKKASQVVSYGLLIGLLPPLIDVFISGLGNFSYNYLDTFHPLIHRAENAIGEAIAVWLSFAALTFYIYIRTRSILRSIVGLAAAYCFLVFMVVYYAGFGEFLIDLGPLDLDKYTIRSLLFLFLAFILYVAMNYRRFLPSLKRVNHTLPWVILVFLGAAVTGRIPEMTYLQAVIVLFVHQGILFANDYYDRNSDRINKRNCHLDKDDVFVIHGIIIWIILTLLFDITEVGVLYIIYFIATTAYHHPSVRLKDIFVVNYMTEGFVALLAFLIGMASAGGTELSSTQLLYPIIAFIGFTVASVFKDYKDIQGDRQTSTRTLYTVLQDRGVALDTIHKSISYLIVCFLSAPLILLYVKNASLLILTLILLFLILPTYFTLKHTNKTVAVERTIWLMNGYLIALIVAVQSI